MPELNPPPFNAREAEALIRSIDSLRKEISSLRSTIETTYVRKEIFEEVRKGQDEDIEAIREWQTWAIRIVLGLVLVAMVSAVLVGGGAIPS